MTSSVDSPLPLRPYQQEALDFFTKSPSGLLAYDVGTGKTLIALAIASTLPFEARILIICPNTLKYSTAEELRKWMPSSPTLLQVIDGPPLVRALQWHAPARFTIVNYETLLRDPQPYSHDWDLIVADEATRIGNPRAKTTRVMAKLRSPRRIAMTGTPVSNSPIELWSILNWCNPGCLSSYWPFLMRYCIREPKFNRIVSYTNLDELAKRIAPHMIRRTKEQVLAELPPRVITDIHIEISEAERDLYAKIRKELIFELTHLTALSLATLGNAIVRMVRLRQLTGHPQLLGAPEDTPTSKLDALVELVERILAVPEEKVLVFTEFASLVPHIVSRLAAYAPARILGELSPLERQREVERFKSDPACRVLVSTPAGGEGLNLQVASHVIHYDLPFSIAKLTQRVGRAHRMGQSRTVFEYRLIARHTVDEHIARILTRKQKLSHLLLSPDQMNVTLEDVKEMLDLSP